MNMRLILDLEEIGNPEPQNQNQETIEISDNLTSISNKEVTEFIEKLDNLEEKKLDVEKRINIVEKELGERWEYIKEYFTYLDNFKKNLEDNQQKVKIANKRLVSFVEGMLPRLTELETLTQKLIREQAKPSDKQLPENNDDATQKIDITQVYAATTKQVGELTKQVEHSNETIELLKQQVENLLLKQRDFEESKRQLEDEMDFLVEKPILGIFSKISVMKKATIFSIGGFLFFLTVIVLILRW